MKFLERFRRGEVLAADKLNKLIDLVNSMVLTSDGSIVITRSLAGTILSVANRNEAVPFINSGGNDCPAYGVLSLNDVTLDTAMPYYLTADRPSTTFKRFQIVNGSEPVPAGDNGFGYIVNGSHNRLCIAAYDGSGTPAGGEEWGVKPSQFTLSKGYPGCFSVLGVLDSTNQWVLGYLHPINELLVKTNGSHAKGVSQSCDVFAGATKGSESDTTINVTCYNRFADLATTKEAIAQWVNGGLELVAGDCS